MGVFSALPIFFKESDKMLRSNEWIETFGKDTELIVSKEYCFSTDTILLADFSMPKKFEYTADFGTGCGAIPFFWRSRGYQGKTLAVEIQKSACKMVERSIIKNNLEDYISIINEDLKNIHRFVNCGTFDLVVCNPPYKKVNHGEQSSKTSRAIARHEVECTVSDIALAAAKLLKFSGRLCLCSRTERLCDVVCELRNAGIEPKKIRFVQQRQDKQPKLFLIEGKKGAKPGIVTLPALMIESQETDRIYNEYKKEN